MKKKIRYAVVGMGHIAQSAVLPAFRNAGTSELRAFVSGDRFKLRRLAKMYGVNNIYTYEEYENCLKSGEIDAVYIALPNNQHREYAEIAAENGIHILCEKPMAVNSKDCIAMVEAARKNGVKLMIAYRLHFEEANLEAIDIVNSGKIGEARVFNSVFTYPVKDHGIRLNPRSIGGGPLYDIGIYCINAARYLFRDEPVEVMAMRVNSKKKPFQNTDEGIAVTLRFHDERIATFVCSFDCASRGDFQVLGTKGDVVLENAYHYQGGKTLHLTVRGKRKTKQYSVKDQFAPEIIYFSNCILKNKQPEPSGMEGLADIRIIEAIYSSIDSRKPISLSLTPVKERPTHAQEISKPPVRVPQLIHAEDPSAEEAA